MSREVASSRGGDYCLGQCCFWCHCYDSISVLRLTASFNTFHYFQYYIKCKNFLCCCELASFFFILSLTHSKAGVSLILSRWVGDSKRNLFLFLDFFLIWMLLLSLSSFREISLAIMQILFLHNVRAIRCSYTLLDLFVCSTDFKSNVVNI